MVAALAYFLLLVNGLSLEDYGVFVSILASALIISNGGTYGFLAPTFRVLTEKAQDRAEYVGGLLAYILTWVPITLLVAVAVHFVLFASYTSLTTTMLIIASEAILMRMIGAAYDLNIATGRYGVAAWVNFLSVLPRIIAVLIFLTFETSSLADWAWFFAAATFASFVITVFLLPRLKWRVSPAALRAGMKEAASQEGLNFIQSLQVELDKVMVLMFVGPVAAGIYSISMRIIYVVSEPVRSLFPLVAQFFITNIHRIRTLRNQLLLEAGLMISCFCAYLAVVFLLSLEPTLLGENVASGFAFFSLLPAVFATKLMPEYHKTVMYGAKRLHKAVWVALSITITKMSAIYLFATNLTFPDGWVWALNGLFLVLYFQSLAATWGWAMREPKQPQSTAASISAE